MKAFPSTKYINERGHQCFNTGMDLRDYFAAKAMQAILSDNFGDTYATLASTAYKAADAMLKERSNETKTS